jgi:cytochrome c oxidase subunit 1
MFQSMPDGPKVTDADVWNLKETNHFTAEWQWFEQRLEDNQKSRSSTGDHSDESVPSFTEDDTKNGE